MLASLRLFTGQIIHTGLSVKVIEVNQWQQGGAHFTPLKGLSRSEVH